MSQEVKSHAMVMAIIATIGNAGMADFTPYARLKEISLPTGPWATRFLAPLEKTRVFGMTPITDHKL